MFKDFKQFVPSQVCLSCEGCCRFKEKDSLWRPRVAEEEKMSLAASPLTEKIFSRKSVDKTGALETHLCSGEHICQFFDTVTHKCEAYQARPFECELYPFLLTRNEDQLNMAVHLSCPFIQERWGGEDFKNYVAYLQTFFQREDVAAFLKRNPFYGNDYSRYKDELDYLFRVKNDIVGLTVDEEILQKQSLVEGYLRNKKYELSVFSFIHLAVWHHFFKFHCEVIHDDLCVFATNNVGTFLYWPPMGGGTSLKRETIDACFDLMSKVNAGFKVSRIENVGPEQLALFPEDEFIAYKKGYEYLYYRQDVSDFKGSPYKSKRADYNYFTKNFSSEYREYQPEMFESCLRLYDDWSARREQKHRDEIYRSFLQENRTVHGITLKYYRELGLIGRVVMIENQIKAYTFGYPLNEEVFCVFLETADLQYKGLPTYIFREFCADETLAKFKFINVMDDFALDNVARTKLSFRPALMIPSYTITKR